MVVKPLHAPLADPAVPAVVGLEELAGRTQRLVVEVLQEQEEGDFGRFFHVSGLVEG